MAKIICYGIETPAECQFRVALYDQYGKCHGVKCTLLDDDNCVSFCDTQDDTKFPADCPLRDESREQKETRMGKTIGKVIFGKIEKPIDCPHHFDLFDKSGNFQCSKCSISSNGCSCIYFCDIKNENDFPKNCPLEDETEEDRAWLGVFSK